jgi:chemotaxis protein methyltransferase WspC
MISSVWPRIELVLAEQLGLEAESVGPNLIRRGVMLRMEELGLQDLNDYLSVMINADAEVQALVEEVVVSESWFFRDLDPFRFLQRHVQSHWLPNPARQPLRVLSIPCAAGEEPYSIVIALREIGLPGARMHVDGVDVSSRRIELARRGIYSENAFRGVNQTLRDRYFRKIGQGFEVDPTVRAHVRFLRGNILDPELLVHQPPYDVIFCRNLLIYLNNAARLAVVTALDRLMAVDGLLILGHADRLGDGGPGSHFVMTGEASAFAYGRKASSATTRCEVPKRRKTLAKEVATSTRPAEQPQSAGPKAPAGECAPASAASLLERAAESANRGRSNEAIALCQEAISRQGPSAGAYFLMGVIYQSTGNRSKGDESFQKAVYLDPAHDEALLALALSAEQRGDAAAAAGFRRRAERAIGRRGAR